MSLLPTSTCDECGYLQADVTADHCQQCGASLPKQAVYQKHLEDPSDIPLEGFEQPAILMRRSFRDILENVFSPTDGYKVPTVLLGVFVFFTLIFVLVIQAGIPGWMDLFLPFVSGGISVLVVGILRFRSSRDPLLKQYVHIFVYLAICLLLLGLFEIYTLHANEFIGTIVLAIATFSLSPVFYILAFDMRFPYYVYPAVVIFTGGCFTVSQAFSPSPWWYPTALLASALIGIGLSIIFSLYISRNEDGRLPELLHHLRICSVILIMAGTILLLPAVLYTFLSTYMQFPTFASGFSDTSVEYLQAAIISGLLLSLLSWCSFLFITRSTQFRLAALYVAIAIFIVSSHFQQTFSQNPGIPFVCLALLHFALSGLIIQSDTIKNIILKNYIRFVQIPAMLIIALSSLIYVFLAGETAFGFLILALVIYIIGFLKKNIKYAWCASAFMLLFLINRFIHHQNSPLFLFIFTVLCVAGGLCIGGEPGSVQEGIDTSLRLIPEFSSKKYSYPLYSIALLSALSTGIQVANPALISLAFFIYALLAWSAARREMRPGWTILIVGFVVWSLVLGAVSPSLAIVLVMGLGLGAGLLGLLAKRLPVVQ